MPRPLRILVRILAWGMGGLLGLVVVLLAAIIVFANTGAGRALIAAQTASLTGGMVRIDGVSGRFPQALRVARVEITDPRGTWLTIRDLSLDWHPLALLGLDARVTRLQAAEIDVARLPVARPAPAKKAAPGGPITLPLGLRLAALEIGVIRVDAPVTGHELTLGVRGHAAIESLQPIVNGPTLENLPASDIGLDLTDAAGHGHYRLEGDVGQGGISLHLTAHETPGGMIASFAHSDQISPLDLELDLDGPRRAEALHLAATAGKLVAGADGLVDLPDEAARLALSVHAPAMQPVQGVSWAGVALDAHLHGRLAAPSADGTLSIDRLEAGGASIASIAATLHGSEGPVALHAVLSGLRIPGPKPELLAASPVTIDANAQLAQPGRPATIHVGHALLDLAATLATAHGIAGHVTLALPSLGKLAAAGGVALDGSAHLDADVALAGPDASLRLAGPIAITGGMPQAVSLIGTTGRIALSASRHGTALTLERLTLDGRALSLAAHGADKDDALDASFHLGLPDLAAASPAIAGHLAIDGTASGPMSDLAATLHASGDVGTRTVHPEPITLTVDAAHLPSAPVAHLDLGGRLDASPVALRADVARPDAKGATSVQLDALSWKSLSGHGAFVLAPGAALPTGTLDLGIARLADLSRLAGQRLSGSVKATLDAGAQTARVAVVANGVAAAGVQVARATLGGTVRDPATRPNLDLRLDTAGIASGAMSADAHATARGPLDALAIGLDARVANLQGAPATFGLASTLDMPKSTLALTRLAADWHGEALRLQAPARIVYAPSVAVEHLRLGLGAAEIAVDGKITPNLALTASLHDVTPALASPVMPDLKAAGRLDADARLTGTPAAPGGTIHVNASGVRLLTGPASSLPAADFAATATLGGGAARIEARLGAGRAVALRVDGTAPLRAGGALDMRADGHVDLAVANPVLEAQGRHLAGGIDLAATATGTTAHPELGGTLTLSRGDLQDFTQGAHLRDIAAQIALAGQTMRIDRFQARAGEGTISASGSVGVLAPAIPISLAVTADHASPVSSDLLSATIDARVNIAGEVARSLQVGGNVTIDRADINIPNGLPPSVATLHVIKPGQKPPPPPVPGAPAHVIALDLAVNAPGQIFVRGHGLDAVLGGALHVGGTAAAPALSGGFELRRGSFSLVGTSLDFTKGTVGFNGTTNGKIDPTIDFVAESVVNQYTADLTVSGYASKPKIALSSNPPLPQDQVMALLLFGSDTKSLSPLQIAQIAAALASITGAGGGFDPLGTVRNTLGLDRLTVGSGTGNGNNTGASVEGGKYVTKRVYVGARQSTSGGGTQALVQIDITKRLKAFTTVGTGGTVTGATTPENDPGSSVGLKYQFRY